MTLIPAPGQIQCLPSPVDPAEEERASGLIVRHATETLRQACDHVVLCGVVVALGANAEIEDFTLVPGVRLYYLHAHRVGEYDFVMASYENVIAADDGE